MSKQSFHAYIDQVVSGKLKTNRDKIYYALNAGSCNLDQLRNRLPIAHQTLTAAISHLMDDGLVYQDDQGVFHVSDITEIYKHAHDRKVTKYEKWYRLGEKNGYFDMREEQMTIEFFGQ